MKEKQEHMQQYTYETQVQIVDKIADLIIQKISKMPNFKKAKYTIYQSGYGIKSYIFNFFLKYTGIFFVI